MYKAFLLVAAAIWGLGTVVIKSTVDEFPPAWLVGVRFTVADTGPGIPDGEKERVFERFYRTDRARTDREHDGLGLCIAREIISLHGGTIRAEDTPGGGATFVVELPGEGRV